jgi:tetratricopeptide (TPR) repeat protein
MAKVARAVQYAHDQSILHRDLKPGNILLDGRGEPLVSDFGLAKWLDTTSDITRTLTIFGTPGYIAPEQARGPAANLTPAADVYSLGAILFNLFTGRPPFLGEHALAVIQQAAEKPAPKLRSLAPNADRDLETICAKCLEREPHARYGSAGDLAEDLERWLEGRPIKTRRVLPQTRAWRWSRRNPVLVGTAAACLFVGAASIWFLWQAGWLQQISIAAKTLFLSPKQAAEQAKLHQALVEYPNVDVELKYSHVGYRNADSRASTPERLYSTLGSRVVSDPRQLREKLPKFAEAVKRNPDAPRYERACAVYLGKDYAESERLSLTAADEAQKASPSAIADTVRALQLAAWSACKMGEFTRAREHLGEAESLIDQSRNPQEWAEVQWAIATVLLTKNDTAGEAEGIVRRVVEVRTHIFGPEHRETLSARRLLALCLLGQAKCPEAEVEFRDLIRLDERILGPEHPESIWSHWDLVTVLSGDFGYADPEACLVEMRYVVKLREKVLGPEHPDTMNARGGLNVMLANLGHYTEAIAQQRELLAVERKVLGPEDIFTILTLYNLGTNLGQIGEFREAEATLREAFQLREKTLGAENSATLYCRAGLAVVLAAQHRDLEAEAEAREVVKVSGRSADREGWGRDYLGAVLDKQGRYPEAEAQLRQALGMLEKASGRTGANARLCRGHLAATLWYQGKNAEAESVLRELIALHERALGAQAYRSGENLYDRGRLSEEACDLTPLTCRILLANTLRDQGKYAEAEVRYKDVIQVEENVLGPEQRDTLNACYNYAYQLAHQGKRDVAKALAERAAKGAAKTLPLNDPDRQEYTKFLEILEKGQPITMPYMKFHEIFLSGKQT